MGPVRYAGFEGYSPRRPGRRPRGHWYDDEPFLPEEAYRRHPELATPRRHPHEDQDGRVGWNRWMEIGMEDDDVRQAVRESLHQDTALAADTIDVEVNGGVVRLSGEVKDCLEVRYAWDDVWETPGVRGVLNHLTVRTDETEAAETP